MKKVASYLYRDYFIKILKKGVSALEDVYVKIESFKAEQKEIMRDIRNLETRTTINEKDISMINQQLEKISMNTTWVLRILMGSVVMEILGLIIKGGM